MQVDFHQNIKILKRWMREIKAVFFFHFGDKSITANLFNVSL